MIVYERGTQIVLSPQKPYFELTRLTWFNTFVLRSDRVEHPNKMNYSISFHLIHDSFQKIEKQFAFYQTPCPVHKQKINITMDEHLCCYLVHSHLNISFIAISSTQRLSWTETSNLCKRIGVYLPLTQRMQEVHSLVALFLYKYYTDIFKCAVFPFRIGLFIGQSPQVSSTLLVPNQFSLVDKKFLSICRPFCCPFSE